MKIRSQTGECTLAVGSVTQAMKARDALATAAIPSTVMKLDTSSLRRGCVYGIAFSCQQENNVRTVLAAARISIK